MAAVSVLLSFSSNNGANAMVAANNKALEVLGDKTFASEADQRKHLQDNMSKSEADQRKHLQDNMSKEDFADYEKLTEFLMQVREEQTVPDALNLFGSVTPSKKEEVSAPAPQTMVDDTDAIAASAQEAPRSFNLYQMARQASDTVLGCFRPHADDDQQNVG